MEQNKIETIIGGENVTIKIDSISSYDEDLKRLVNEDNVYLLYKRKYNKSYVLTNDIEDMSLERIMNGVIFTIEKSNNNDEEHI